MPILEIQVSDRRSSLTRTQILRRASALVAEALGKPESCVMVSLKSPYMMLDHARHPVAYMQLKSVDLTDEQIQRLSSELSTYVLEVFGVPADRTYIEFANLNPEYFAWNGKPLAESFKSGASS